MATERPTGKALALNSRPKHVCTRSYTSNSDFPPDYVADWETLIVCLSSIGDPNAHLCRHWE